MLIRSNMGLPLAEGLSPTQTLGPGAQQQAQQAEQQWRGGNSRGGTAPASTDGDSGPVLARPSEQAPSG